MKETKQSGNQLKAEEKD